MSNDESSNDEMVLENYDGKTFSPVSVQTGPKKPWPCESLALSLMVRE